MVIKRYITVRQEGYNVDVPDACPICHHHSEIQFLTADDTQEGAAVQAIFQCGYLRCRSYFICYYGPRGESELKAVKPVKPQTTQFPDAVHRLSPSFVQIFVQAEEAAQIGLSQIAGPGYRKAFEFLIKDYAKSLSPGKETEIEGRFAGAVVNDFIADARIQAVAKRCLWLGNDETHYLRKWTDHDLGDLVTLIRLTANWIEIEHLSKSYVEDMPE